MPMLTVQPRSKMAPWFQLRWRMLTRTSPFPAGKERVPSQVQLKVLASTAARFVHRNLHTLFPYLRQRLFYCGCPFVTNHFYTFGLSLQAKETPKEIMMATAISR